MRICQGQGRGKENEKSQARNHCRRVLILHDRINLTALISAFFNSKLQRWAQLRFQ
ncbi:hypothetical protein TREAZ_3187 [Leadbettera azotonutricia ZAS-9]|uniref:Uncharacterized protein n=1 Tax=Leadbettera azotonutricia (strain ATCC BAA-888 / DSM 13862 / ZAS-9) TaxID=545695 RepID=F5Y9T3_LEAAZ|nr:hypothetical protein TREAZ_3187 [Leadbettera azotonutricia ZAS-9]